MINPTSNYPFNSNNYSFTGRNIIKKPPKIHDVAVVDFFNQKIQDINGDGIADFSHGKFCKSVIKSILPNAHVKNYRLASYKGQTGDENMNSVAKNFHSIAEKIKNGEKIDAVNFSFQIVKTFDELSKFLKTKITKENVHEHAETLKNWLKDLANPENKALAKEFDPKNQGLKEIHKAITSIEEVTSQGTPVYICAGNFGPETFNLYTLANKSTAVKALDGDKINSKPLYFSCDNSISKRGTRGVYYPREILDKNGKIKGYKISEKSKSIIKAKELSKNPPTVDKFVGKNIQDALAKPEDYIDLKTFFENGSLSNEKKEHLKNIVFDVNKFAKTRKSAGKMLPTEFKFFLKKHATYVDINMQMLLKADKNGKIISDPEHKGIKALTACKGTSYAAPCLLAKDLKTTK